MGVKAIWILRFFLVATGLSVVCPVYVHADDFATWTGVKADYKLNGSWMLQGGLEFRSKNHFRQADRWGANLGLQYNILSFLSVQGGYEAHYLNRNLEGWKFRHRYNVGISGKVDWKNFQLSLRERLEETFFSGSSYGRLRSRLKVRYQPRNWNLRPYFSVELYQPVGDDDFFRIARMRYRPGIEANIGKHYTLEMFYCRQYEPDVSKNIWGLELKLHF